jgi:GntR family transcriptional regulator
MEIERPKPIAEQINKILRQRIRKGIYPPGSRMPTERELVEEFGVSRTTLRIATASLLTDGLIRRRQGDGTYVSKKALEFSIRERGFRSYSKVIEESGYKPSIEKATFNVRVATEDETRSLELDSQELIASLIQIIYAEGKPAIFSTYIIPTIFFIDDVSKCDPFFSIHELLNQYCNQKIAYISREISAAIAMPEIMEVFCLNNPSPFLKFTDKFYNTDDIPIVLSTSFYDDSILKFGLIHRWND